MKRQLNKTLFYNNLMMIIYQIIKENGITVFTKHTLVTILLLSEGRRTATSCFCNDFLASGQTASDLSPLSPSQSSLWAALLSTRWQKDPSTSLHQNATIPWLRSQREEPGGELIFHASAPECLSLPHNWLVSVCRRLHRSALSWAREAVFLMSQLEEHFMDAN